MSRPDPSGAGEICLHANCIGWNGQGALILGASGAGKSSLSLHLMALGCDLVADDRTILTRHNDTLHARSPATIEGQIEARGVGILRAAHVPWITIGCVIDLGQIETERLPPVRRCRYLGVSVRLFHNPETSAFPYAILQYIKSLTVSARDAEL